MMASMAAGKNLCMLDVCILMQFPDDGLFLDFAGGLAAMFGSSNGLHLKSFL